MPAQTAECQRKPPIKYQTETAQSLSSRLPTAGVELWIIIGEVSNEIVGLQARLCTIIHSHRAEVHHQQHQPHANVCCTRTKIRTAAW